MRAQGYANQLEQYQLIKYLGKTTMLAKHKTTNKVVAIKVISYDQNSQSDEQLGELTLESHLEPLEQSGIMKMSEHIVEENFTYLVRPYYNQGNLIEAMNDHRINLLTEKEIGKKAQYICDALAAIHSVGFVHGDVRPQSIFYHKSVTTGVAACVFGDFDRCCPIEIMGEQQPYEETDQDRLLYLSPESIRSEELQSTPASDIWSLGVTLYVLATGKYPFNSVEQIYAAPLTWPIETPLSRKFKTLVSGMLCKDQNERMTMRNISRYQWRCS